MRSVTRRHDVKPKRRNTVVMLLLVLQTFAVCIPAVASEESVRTYLFITPIAPTAKVLGETFDISICIGNAQNLSIIEFTLVYNSTLIDLEQVLQGDFFPVPPRSSFEFEDNHLLSSFGVRMSLSVPEPPRNGNGTLAVASFKAVQYLPSCYSSPISFSQILLFDNTGAQIASDSCGAIFFWKSIIPDPPPEGRLFDLYSPRGGGGQSVPGGDYTKGDLVNLMSRTEYSGSPVQSKLVAFEVINAENEVVAIRVTTSDQGGFAGVIFRIPDLLESIGTWTIVSTVEIAGEVVWDVMTIQVHCMAAVGGYSYTAESQEITSQVILYLAVLFLLSAGTRTLRPGRKLESRLQ